MADTPKQFLHLTPDKCVTVHYKTKKSITGNSVTRLGDLLDFGQVFKAFGNNKFAQISHILRQFL